MFGGNPAGGGNGIPAGGEPWVGEPFGRNGGMFCGLKPGGKPFGGGGKPGGTGGIPRPPGGIGGKPPGGKGGMPSNDQCLVLRCESVLSIFLPGGIALGIGGGNPGIPFGPKPGGPPIPGAPMLGTACPSAA